MIRRAALLLLAVTLIPAAAVAQAAPTAEQLGVPAYPGARYDARMSAGMSQETQKYYIFTTADSAARVVRFYESATRKTGTAMDLGATLIVIAGRAPFPSHGVMIEPNRQGMYPPEVKTVLTVIRQLPESPQE